jgi:O-antigen/teichoic acid export membrane protein
MVVALPGLVLALAGPRDLIVLLFGQEFAEAGAALPVLLGAFVVMCVGYLLGALVIAFGLQRAFLAFAAIAFVFNVVANLLLVPDHGFVAAAWITLLTEVLISGLTLVAVARRGGIPLPDRRLAGAVAAGAAAWAVAFGANQAGAPVLAWAVAGTLVYAGLLLLLRVASIAELRELRSARAG